MKQVPLSELKDDLSRFLREAEKREIVITRHGKPAGVLIGFESEEDWFNYRLENDPRFLERVALARRSLRALGALRGGNSYRQARQERKDGIASASSRRCVLALKSAARHAPALGPQGAPWSADLRRPP